MSQDIIACNKCGTNNLRGQRYCSGCNQRLHYKCPSCEEDVDNVLHNCPKCKVALDWPTFGSVKSKSVRPARAPSIQRTDDSSLPERPHVRLPIHFPGRSSGSRTSEGSVNPKSVDRGRALLMIAGLGLVAVVLLIVLILLVMAAVGSLG